MMEDLQFQYQLDAPNNSDYAQTCKMEQQIKPGTKRIAKQLVGLSAEVLKSKFIQTCPQMSQAIQGLSYAQLNQIYKDILKTQVKAPPKPTIMEMAEAIIQKKPSLRELIWTLPQDQVARQYQKYQGEISLAASASKTDNYLVNNKPLKIKGDHGKSKQAIVRNQAPQYMFDDIEQQDLQLQLPNQYMETDQLTRMHASNFYSSNVSEKDQEDMSWLEQLPKTNKPVRSKKIQQVTTKEARNSNGKTQLWTMNHQGSDFKPQARTYVMIHTDYSGKEETQPCGYQCQCGKSYTIRGIFNQVIAQIERHSQ